MQSITLAKSSDEVDKIVNYYNIHSMLSRVHNEFLVSYLECMI